LAIVWHCLRDSVLSRFQTIPHVWRTDRRADTRRRHIPRYSISSRGKTHGTLYSFQPGAKNRNSQ